MIFLTWATFFTCGIIIPEAPAPLGSYVAFKIVGKLLFISGQISLDTNGKLIKGKVGS